MRFNERSTWRERIAWARGDGPEPADEVDLAGSIISLRWSEGAFELFLRDGVYMVRVLNVPRSLLER